MCQWKIINYWEWIEENPKDATQIIIALIMLISVGISFWSVSTIKEQIEMESKPILSVQSVTPDNPISPTNYSLGIFNFGKGPGKINKIEYKLLSKEGELLRTKTKLSNYTVFQKNEIFLLITPSLLNPSQSELKIKTTIYYQDLNGKEYESYQYFEYDKETRITKFYEGIY